ncbi:NAD(P)/FAD-dependent oxidoreductase [Paenibacillus chitinolyticus]|uniref:NAD(P)/FAD-dependent oxidoreductase n=1 Tax=Paenibacillus chitinolyticus TaxID=79263 RepID=UPI0038681472
MYDLVIIGAGPAGASAGLIAARAGKKTLLIDSGQSMTKRAWIENHYGVAEISGPDMVELGKKQAAKFGAELAEGKVESVDKQDDGFLVTSDQGSYEARHVLLATGALADLADKIGVTTIPGTEPRIKTIVQTDANNKTSVEGIWAAGTIAGMSVHTIITAGDGAKAAINIVSELNGERYVDHDVLKS